jgi:ribosomal protein L11 methyltransferase
LTYYRIEILPGENRDAVLASLAHIGIEEQEGRSLVYFDSKDRADEAARFIGNARVEAIDDCNWSAAVQEQWEPIAAGSRFWLCPEWMTGRAPEGRIRLERVAGNVFGGGDHPTTILCLEAMEKVVRPGMRVADIGAGTAILCRAARALGASALACDIDPASAPFVDVLGSADAFASAAFDLVVANIHLAVLREIRDDLLRIGRTGSILLLSGFLREQLPEIIERFPGNYEIAEKNGWCIARIFPSK